jgi:hypothetical protein
MEHFTFVSTVKTTVQSVRYLLLDSIEGKDCFGHWMIECALFLPYLDALRAHSPLPLKILLTSPKHYKKVVLSDFGIREEDIEYSNRSNHLGGAWQRTHVIPVTEEYEAYRPNYTFCWDTSLENTLYFQHIRLFCEHFMKSPVEKDIDVLFLKRSAKENYHPGGRVFANLDIIIETMKSKNYKILEVEYLDLDLANAKMYDRNAFKLPREKNIVKTMLDYYLNHKYS